MTFISLLIALPAAEAHAQDASAPPTDGTESTEIPTPPEAGRSFEIATEAFERGDFANALVEWERTYELLQGHPRRSYVLYNIARANEELGRIPQALESYERFLAESSDDAPNRPEAQRHVQELQLRLQLASQDSAPQQPAAPATGDSGGGFSPSPVGIAIASVGAAAMIAGAIVGGVALAQDGDARGDCDSSRCTDEAHAALIEAHTLANAADGLLWGGLAVLATGAVLTFVLGESGTTRAGAGCTADGCIGTVRGEF